MELMAVIFLDDSYAQTGPFFTLKYKCRNGFILLMRQIFHVTQRINELVDLRTQWLTSYLGKGWRELMKMSYLFLTYSNLTFWHRSFTFKF
jgi:hypothetical protein